MHSGDGHIPILYMYILSEVASATNQIAANKSAHVTPQSTCKLLTTYKLCIVCVYINCAQNHFKHSVHKLMLLITVNPNLN